MCEINKLLDKKVDCLSVITNIKINEFINIVREAYRNRGGISGQRDALKQKTAIVIRNRMIEDIKGGAVLPPIVLGVVVSKDDFNKLVNNEIEIEEHLKTASDTNISIIDGMQRTSAILKALETETGVGENQVRVEYWISYNNNSLLYRMLVLNTGQVPWNMKRQIEVIFNGVIKEIEERVEGIEIFKVDTSSGRRRRGGAYQASELVELFLAFGARSWKVNTKEKLTDEFTRHDFIQSSSETDLVELFCDVLECLYRLDIALNKLQIDACSEGDGKFKNGYDLFKTQTSRIGFISSISEKILGRPGIDKDKDKRDEEKEKFILAINKVISKVDNLQEIELQEYLDFETLNERMGKKTSNIGDYERELFYSAFKVLWEENGDLDNLGPCWRAL